MEAGETNLENPYQTMRTDFPFHHSFIDQERAERQREDVRSWLVAGLVVAMFFAGCVIGYFLK